MKLELKNWRSTFKWQVGDFEGDLKMIDGCRGLGRVVSNNLKSCPCMFIPNQIWLMFGFCQTIITSVRLMGCNKM